MFIVKLKKKEDMKKLLVLILFIGSVSMVHAQGARTLMDFNTPFSYGAQAKLQSFGTLSLGEVSLGSITGVVGNGSVDSKLAFIDPKHVATFLSLPRPIFAVYLIVKIESGRLVPGTEEEVKQNKAIRLIFKYGQLLPECKPTFDLPNALKDYRTIGLLDLQFTIFYEMNFEKSGKDFPIWQTAETIVDTTDKSVSMQLVSFTDKSDFDKLKSLKYQTRIESVQSTWSDKKDKFVHNSESDWAGHFLWLIRWDKTDRYTLEKAWSADIPTEPKGGVQNQGITGSTNSGSMGQSNNSAPQFSISATKSGAITTVSWTAVTGASGYRLELLYPGGGTKQFNETGKTSMDLKNLPPGTFTATVYALGPTDQIIFTGKGQITN